MTLNTQALLLACIAAAFATAATAQTCPFTDHADPSITYEAKVGGFLTDSRADHYRVEPDCRLRLVTSADLPRRVQAVLFVESDQRQTAEMVPGIERHMVRLQDMYRQSFGRTFTLANPAVRVLKARHNSDWYINTPDGVHTDPRWYRLGNMKNEVNEKLKRIDDDLRIRVVNYPIRVSNGKVGGNFG